MCSSFNQEALKSLPSLEITTQLSQRCITLATSLKAQLLEAIERGLEKLAWVQPGKPPVDPRSDGVKLLIVRAVIYHSSFIIHHPSSIIHHPIHH